MKKIILFMVYYGKLPIYFDIWLNAVSRNQSIDFCIISDLLTKYNLPSNVKLFDITFETFKEKIQNRFSFHISLDNYGRISQFRPALAYIFPEIVRPYDYWGYIECDLIPGNIRKFITDDVLSNHDKIFKLGHFQIFKNNQKMNTLFMRKYKSALSYKFAFSQNILYFEELLGMHNIANAAQCKTYDENIFADIKCYKYLFECSQYSYNGTAKEGHCLFSYTNGELKRYTLSENGTIDIDEILYIHLQKRNMQVEIDDFDSYIIVPNSFKPYQNIDINVFNEELKEAQIAMKNYENMITKKLNIQKKENNKKLAWWILRFKRFFIRKNGGIDLNGN